MGQKKATSSFCYMQTTSCKIGQLSKLGNNNKRSNQWRISPSSREMNPVRVLLLFARVDLNVHYISDLKHQILISKHAFSTKRQRFRSRYLYQNPRRNSTRISTRCVKLVDDRQATPRFANNRLTKHQLLARSSILLVKVTQ